MYDLVRVRVEGSGVQGPCLWGSVVRTSRLPGTWFVRDHDVVTFTLRNLRISEASSKP